jgi:hypothetical protein
MYCIYANNARLAEYKTVERYGSTGGYGTDYLANRTCSHCKANAFKHGLFRCLDARYFGSEIAAKLGDAHESSTLLGTPQDIRESQMDIHNNNVGIKIYNSHSSKMEFIKKIQVDTWSEKVNSAMNEGTFYYLGSDGITKIKSNQ